MENENLNPQKSPEEKIEETSLTPVVSGRVSVKPKSEGKKIVETFFKGDLESVKRSIWRDVVVPTIKDMLWSTLERAGRGLIYGDSERYSRSDRDRDSARARQVDFTAYSRRPERPRDRDRDPYYDANDIYDYGELRFEFDRGPDGGEWEARKDAENVRANMADICAEYRWVSVAQMFELAGLPKKYTDRDWGWTNVDNARIERGRNCYILRLDRPRPIK